MARTNNLTNFLTDVSSAIKQKTGDNTPIPASNFDTEILSIETVGNYQDKSITITENGSFNILPDTGYDAISNVRMTVDVEGSTPMEPTTATQDDVISPKTFYSNGQKLVGSIIPEYRREDGTPDTNSNIPNNGTTVCVTPDKKYVIQFGGSFYIYSTESSQLIKTIAISNFSGTRRYIAIANEPYDTNKYFMYISNTVGGLYMYSYDSEEMTITYLHYTNFGNNYNDTIFAMSKEQSNIMAVASRTYIRTYRITTTGVVQISNSGISNERTGSLEFQKHDTILVHNNNYVWDSRLSYIRCKT